MLSIIKMNKQKLPHKLVISHESRLATLSILNILSKFFKTSLAHYLNKIQITLSASECCLCSLIDDYFALPFTQVRDHRNADGAFKLKCQVIRAPAECFGATKQHLKASLDNPPPSPPPPHSSSNCRQVLQVLSTVICAYKLHLGLQRRRLWRRFVLVCCCCCTSKQ